MSLDDVLDGLPPEMIKHLTAQDNQNDDDNDEDDQDNDKSGKDEM